jgi:formamidopyrimidine-DNA glycosylase
MPELPETETIARDLDGRVRGARFEGADVLRADVLRDVDADGLGRGMRGATITRAWRRAKLVVLDLTVRDGEGRHLVVQPRFTGALLIDDGTLDPELQAYVCLRLRLADGRALLYRDVRRLGTVALMDDARFTAYAGALGLEPLDPSCTPAALQRVLGRSARPIKAALMDQTRLAGVGNIYATEACWAAAIDPSREARTLHASEWARLHDALTERLTASIAARGTSFRDYRDAAGGRGTFVAQLQVYGRGGAPCPRCAHRLVSTDAIDGRGTVFCAWCQR